MKSDVSSHDILVVSSTDKMASSLKRTLTDGRYRSLEVRVSASTTRRELMEREYDVAIINVPLSDEPGIDLAVDISDRYPTGVIIIASSEIAESVAERVTDHGIIVIPKPASVRAVSRSVRLMCAIQDKLRGARKKAQTLEDKMEEIRIVNRAKWHLIDTQGMSEEEAHKYIGKYAMDKCISRGEAASRILDDQG